jgi:hypothetical protein
MGRPYRIVPELEGHLDRGELDFAIALAKTLAHERVRPLDLRMTLRFLPLVAIQRPDTFDEWTLRWLERWCGELRGQASIDDALDVVTGLAEIPVDPDHGLETIAAVFARYKGTGASSR